MHKLIKSLLLAAPATLVGVAAQAADLPARKAAPVEYVRVCDAYGAGFFYIPGTDTCLRVGGYVRFETRYNPGHNIVSVANGAVTQIAGAEDQSGMEVRGRIFVDGRTQTQWGTVQTYVRLRGTNTDGMYHDTAAKQFSTSITPAGNGSTSITMERAFIRFAGLTAGVAGENFVTLPAYMFGPGTHAGFPNGIKQLAYTATFGNGFSATLALESKTEFEGSNVQPGIGAVNNLGVPYAYGNTYNNRFYDGYALVGNVRYDAHWGFVQLAGAVQDNTINGPTLTSTYNPLQTSSGYTGWAIGLSGRYNLPMIAPGDQLNLEATYAHGFAGLVISNGSLNNLSNAAGAGFVLGGVQTYINNIIATSAAGGVVTSVGQTDEWQVEGIFTHYWAPQWRSNLELGYLGVNAPTAAASAGVQEGDASVFHAGANLIWSPVKDFNLGVEIDYEHLAQSIQNPTAAFVAAGSPGLHENGVTGILRIERGF